MARVSVGHLLGKGYVIAVRVRVIQIFAVTDKRQAVSHRATRDAPHPSQPTPHATSTDAPGEARRRGGEAKLSTNTIWEPVNDATVTTGNREHREG